MLAVAEVGQGEGCRRRDDRVAEPPTTAVIHATKAAGLDSYPGVFTATEALGALAAGADALKFFPADVLGPAGIKAIATILPKGVPLLAVGGVDADTIGWLPEGRHGRVRHRLEPLQAR